MIGTELTKNLLMLSFSSRQAKNWLQIFNAEAVADSFARKGEFTRPTEMLEMLDVFRPNLTTTEAQQSQRHRKNNATCFNENNNQLVWHESICQATGMVRYWKSNWSFNSAAGDTRTLSLHVMSTGGFRKSHISLPGRRGGGNGSSIRKLRRNTNTRSPFLHRS